MPKYTLRHLFVGVAFVAVELGIVLPLFLPQAGSAAPAARPGLVWSAEYSSITILIGGIAGAVVFSYVRLAWLGAALGIIAQFCFLIAELSRRV